MGSVWLGKKFGKGSRDTWGHLCSSGRTLSLTKWVCHLSLCSSSLRTFLSAKGTSRDSGAVASCLQLGRDGSTASCNISLQAPQPEQLRHHEAISAKADSMFDVKASAPVEPLCGECLELKKVAVGASCFRFQSSSLQLWGGICFMRPGFLVTINSL